METDLNVTYPGSHFIRTTLDKILLGLYAVVKQAYQKGWYNKRLAEQDAHQEERRKKADKIYRRILKGEGSLTVAFDEVGNCIASLVWQGSGNKPYNVLMNKDGLVCNCPDFMNRRHGLCKHGMALIGAFLKVAPGKVMADLVVFDVEQSRPHPRPVHKPKTKTAPKLKKVEAPKPKAESTKAPSEGTTDVAQGSPESVGSHRDQKPDSVNEPKTPANLPEGTLPGWKGIEAEAQETAKTTTEQDDPPEDRPTP